MSEAAAYLIRRERLRARMSQAELARRVGTAQSAISRWEQARSSPSLATLERVLAAAGSRLVLGAERDDGS